MKKLFKKDQKGFTLAELLIVVAIIAVLVAISIPIFTTQLEKSREATDAANLRAAYAEQSAALLTWDGTSTITDITVKSKQTQPNWQNTVIDNIGGIKCGNASGDIKAQTGGDAWTIKANTTTNKIEITPVVTP